MDGHWFESWFDSPYYPLLYFHRNEEEAGLFLDQLIDFIQPNPTAKVLDLACGRGRHARYLHQKGFDVTGLDLSPVSILEAKSFETPGLRFGIHDIRKPFRSPQWDLVLNLFTSFGYFDKEVEHHLAMQTMASALFPGGTLVIDFLNPTALSLLPEPGESLEKNMGQISFTIRKYAKSGYALKEIEVCDRGQTHRYQEKVRLFTLEDLEDMAKKAGLNSEKRFGNYQLGPWTPNSERSILILKKS